MKKKVLSIFLALMLCLSLLPTAALAEEAGTAGAGDTLAAEQGEGNTVTEQDEGNTVTEQDEDSTGTGQDGDSTGTGQGEGNVLSKQSVSAAAFSSAAGTHSHENGTVVFAKKLSQNEDGILQIGGETWENDGFESTYVLPEGSYYLETNLTLDGGIMVHDKVTLCLNGKSITCTTDHAVISVYPNATFTLTDCERTGTITHGKKGDGSKFPGSGVSVVGGTFHMKGGSITGNSADVSGGGGVYLYQGAFNMSGGSITGNTTTGDGGGVWMYDGTFNMSGGSITDNTAVNGGGVYVHGTEIGVTTAKTPAASSPITIAVNGNGGYGMTADDAKVFFADDLVNYRTEFVGGVVQLSTGETQMVHPVCGMECTHKNEDGSLKHPDVTWKPWSNTTTLPNDTGNYYLTADVTLTKTWSFTKVDGVALDLNGKTVSITTSDKTIESCRDVTLTDCRGGGKITHK